MAGKGQQKESGAAGSSGSSAPRTMRRRFPGPYGAERIEYMLSTSLRKASCQRTQAERKGPFDTQASQNEGSIRAKGAGGRAGGWAW